MNNFDLQNFNYQLHLNSMSNNQSSIINYVSECVCLESGDFDGIVSINESVMDSIINAVKGIMKAISNLWAKFVEKTNALLTTDLSYIEKYKDIITKKPFKARTIEMYDYDLANLNVAIPKFNMAPAMKSWLSQEVDEAKASFLRTFMPSITIHGDESNVTEAIKRHIRNSDNEIEMDIRKLDKEIIYDFVYNYKKNVDAMAKVSEVMNANEAEVTRIIANLKPKVDEKEKKETKAGNGTSTPTSNSSANISSNPIEVKESTVYSSVYESYITESKVKIGKVSSDNVVKTDEKMQGLKNVSKDTASSLNTSYNNKDAEDLEALTKNAATFFRCCGEVIAAQLTVCQEIQKNYMAILKAHVSSYVGDK